jgi:hypothetical protein
MFGQNSVILHLFTKGKVANHMGKLVTVDHVIVRGYDLYVSIETGEHIHTKDLVIEPTTISLIRK